MQLQSVGDSMNRARERRLLIERQLADDPQSGSSADFDPAIVSTAQQLDAAQKELAQDRLHYTAENPDVRALERTIRELQARLTEEAQRPPAPAPKIKVPTPAEVAEARRVQDLRDQLAALDRELASDDAEERRLKAAIATYQARVEAAPTRESQLVELTRDYSTLQTTYDGLLAKRQESQVAASLERRQISEQFRILDPASLPSKPYNGRARLGIMSAGAVGGLLLGIALVAFLEYRDSSFGHEEDVLKALSLPVLALIPMMTSEVERSAGRRRRLAFDIAGVAVLLVSVAMLILWTVRS